ncbi:MAG: S-layer homology domain-containing protein [Bacillota bacterium]
MKRRLPGRLALVLGALLLLWAQVAAALSYYEPSPQGLIGISRPTISQQLELAQGEKISAAEMWINGRVVHPSWDETGRVYYTPAQPFSPGIYRVKLVVRVAPGRPGYFYAPVESEFTFTVDQRAVAELPKPGPEELRALAWVNRYREAAGLAPLSYDVRLAAAALGHARYLVANPEQVDKDGHGEVPGAPLFLGVTVGDRARYFAYDGGSFEVINFVDRAEDAVDGWMDTLYHRIPLLHPGMSAMGYGVAGPLGKNVNIIQSGPFGERGGIIRWPFEGQSDVPPMWDGLESPDPFDLYPQVAKPVGYPITLTFGGRPRSLRLTGWSLTGPDGAVEVARFDPVNDPRLEDTVSLIPIKPLTSNAAYTVRMQGEVDLGDGARPFDHRWSFQTAAEYRPILKSRVATTTIPGNELRSVRLEGMGFAPGLRLYLDGLPVEGLEVLSESRLTFLPPAGYAGQQADLLVVTPGGTETLWRSFFGQERFAQPQAQPFAQIPLLVRGQGVGRSALLHKSGALLLPEEAILKLGGSAERVGEIKRTYWRLGDQAGEYTLGRVAASLGEAPLLLALPVQEWSGTTYADATFVRSLSKTETQLIAGELYLGNRILGILDIEGHWGLAAVRRLLEAGIVSGYGDGSYRPNATLSRSAFVKMLTAANGLPLRTGDGGGFLDTGSHWVTEQGYLGAAVAAGLIRPDEYPGRRFEPDRAISREEIAVMVTRALGLEQEAQARQIKLVGGAATLGARTFSDASTWIRSGYIAVAVEAGIITGYAEPDGRYTFRPERSATRAEAAVMVVRALDR